MKILIVMIIVVVALLFGQRLFEELSYKSSFNNIDDNIIGKFARYLVDHYDVICFDFSSNLVRSEDSKLLREVDWVARVPDVRVPESTVKFLQELDQLVKQHSDKHIAITTRNNNGKGVEEVLRHHVGISPPILYGRHESALNPDHTPENRISDRVFIGEYSKTNMLLHLSEWYTTKHGTVPIMVMFDDVLLQVWSCYNVPKCKGVLTNKWEVERNFSARNLWMYWKFLFKGK